MAFDTSDGENGDRNSPKPPRRTPLGAVNCDPRGPTTPLPRPAARAPGYSQLKPNRGLTCTPDGVTLVFSPNKRATSGLPRGARVNALHSTRGPNTTCSSGDFVQ